ncbi:unnamed protein product [Amoebophrya sp. A25]|nr:unnamed protein product [Amoebophrya sp. A25]|eukprot:GSA25T00000668001.1
MLCCGSARGLRLNKLRLLDRLECVPSFLTFLVSDNATAAKKILIEEMAEIYGLDLDVDRGGKSLLLFNYKPGTANKVHQDRITGAGSGRGSHVSYTCMVMASQSGAEYTAGEFFVNDVTESMEISADGKTVLGENVAARTRIPLKLGDVIIFNNRTLVHGVEAVAVAERPGSCTQRVTFSVRSTMPLGLRKVG